MTERFVDMSGDEVNEPGRSVDVPDWERREVAIAAAREQVGDGLQLGTISVKYHSDYAAYGTVWIEATCSEHDGELMSWASHPLQVRDLALAYARNVCHLYGHEQDVAALAAESMPQYPEIEDA